MIPMEPPVVGLINDAAAILVALGALLVAALVMLGKVHAQGKEIRDQVSNTHQTNLRDDLDNLTALIERVSRSQSDMKAVVHRVEATAEAIRGEARDDRARVGRIEAEAHDTHNDLYRLIRDIKKE